MRDVPSPPTNPTDDDNIFNQGQTAAARGAQAGVHSFVVSIVYNQNPAPIPSAAYRIVAMGEDSAGVPTAGIVVTSPPALPPHGWGIGLTELTPEHVFAALGVAFRLRGMGFVP